MNKMYNTQRSSTERKPRSASASLASGQIFFRRQKSCPLSGPNAPVVDYKNIKLLSRFISERGRILPSRITFVCSKKQRELQTAIKRARQLALLPFAKQ
jgi:small subunit ribosomal protein S18